MKTSGSLLGPNSCQFWTKAGEITFFIFIHRMVTSSPYIPY